MPHPNSNPDRARLVAALVLALPSFGMHKGERTIRNWLNAGGPREPLMKAAWDKAMAKVKPARSAKAKLAKAAS